MQNKAKSLIPGMTQLLSKRPDMFAPGVWPGFYSKAEGVKVWDLDGNEYTDMSISGIGANILGYADPDVNEAVKKAIDLGSSCSLNCTEEVELAELFCELHPWAEKARFARSGGEAMALAVRIARAYKCRDKIAFCGYHGWHDWYLATNLAVEDGLGQQCISGLEPRACPKALPEPHFPSVTTTWKSWKKSSTPMARKSLLLSWSPFAAPGRNPDSWKAPRHLPTRSARSSCSMKFHPDSA